MRHHPTQREDAGFDFDPSVDVLVGLVAIVLLVTLMLVPLLDLSDGAPRGKTLTHNGRPVLQIITSNQSLTIISGAETAEYQIEDLRSNIALQDQLWLAKSRMEHPALFIEAGGLEAAFLLEPILANVGFTDISRVYLNNNCTGNHNCRQFQTDQ